MDDRTNGRDDPRSHQFTMVFFKLFFIAVQLQLSFPTTTLPNPSHPHFPHLILPLFGFVHVSFGEGGAQLIVLAFGLIRTALSR